MFTERLEAVRMNSVLPRCPVAGEHGNSPARWIRDLGCWHLNIPVCWLTRLGLFSANNH